MLKYPLLKDLFPVKICRHSEDSATNSRWLVSARCGWSKIMAAYRVCSIAGCGKPGHRDGDRRTCELNCPSGIALDADDAVWVTDRQNHCIRRLPGREEKVDPSREEWITTPVGQGKRPGSNENYVTSTPGSRAQFREPGGICCAFGDVFVTDRDNHAIRCISASDSNFSVRTVAGDFGKEANASGWNTKPVNLQAARFNRPFGIAASNSARALFVADTGNNCVRRIDLGKQEVSTVEEKPETRLEVSSPMGICIDANNCIYVSEWGANRISRISADGHKTVFAGTGAKGYQDGMGSSAQFFHPCGLAIDPRGVVYVADFGNHCIRRIAPSGVVTSIGRSGLVLVNDGMRYVCSSLGCLDAENADNACFNSPQGVAVDSEGDIWVADWGNHAVRKIEHLQGV